MTELEIVDTIKQIKKEIARNKNEGRFLIEHLARKALNAPEDQKDDIVKFFIKEIRFNDYDLWDVALGSLEEMNASETAQDIFSIYCEISENRNVDWKRKVVETLLRLQYKAPKYFYSSYITEYAEKNDSGYAYYLLVLYCHVDSEYGLPLLAEYYVNSMEGNDENRKNFLDNRIDFLVAIFVKNYRDNFLKLIDLISLKNKEVGRHLKTILLGYLSRDISKLHRNELTTKVIDDLLALEI